MDLTWWSTAAPFFPYLISAMAILIFFEQMSYIKNKRYLPGPTLVLPFIGNTVSLVRNPAKFWEIQSSMAKSSLLGISGNYIIGKYILYIYSTDLSHRVLTNVRPDAFQFTGHPFGKKLFGKHSMTYMFGHEHKDLRRRVDRNFTAKALQTYAIIQQRIIIKHLASWCETKRNKSIPIHLLCRDMNLETSQKVFVGPYLSDEARQRFNEDYNTFTVGTMALPIDLPGFAFGNARLAGKRLVGTLAACAEESEKKMNSGEEPTCLIDFWMQDNLMESDEKRCGEIAGHMFDFLFAAQDASTSSLLWAVTYLDSHPHVLERVREEVAGHWSPENDAVFTSEQLRGMKYTEAVAREVVRIRAPATIIPHIAGGDFRLTDDYVVRKGTLVFPSVFDSCYQGFPDPEKFDPDRFMEERQEDRVYRRNYLAFGTGPHQCVGRRYAIQHLVLFISMFATLVDFRRDKTDGCDEIDFVPTIIPKDGCRGFLAQRCRRFPSL